MDFGLDAFSAGEPQNDFPVEPQNELDGMFGKDDDDIYGACDPVPAANLMEEEPSALAKWEQEKKEEIAVKDAEEQKLDEEIKIKAKAAADAFYKNLEEAQEKRHLHNKEVDEQTIAAQESTLENQWERVVSYIDFNRTDLHEKDVSRMKSLLLQLKH